MIRNLKALGVALAAVFAMSAMTASAASAEETQGELTSDGPVTLDTSEIGAKGSKNNALTALGGRVECFNSKITGHNYLTEEQTETGLKHEFIETPVTTITATPDWEQKECRAFLPILGERPATVEMTECDLVFHIGKTTEAADTYGLTTSVGCPPGQEIHVEIFKSGAEHIVANRICTMTFGTQTISEGNVHVTSDTVNDDLVVKGTYEGIKYNHEGTVCGTGEKADGKFDVNATVTGTNEAGGKTGITVTDSRA